MAAPTARTRALRRMRTWRESHESRDERIRAAHAAGFSERQITREMGLARGTVRTALKRREDIPA